MQQLQHIGEREIMRFYVYVCQCIGKTLASDSPPV